jgi:hypothetical protein
LFAVGGVGARVTACAAVGAKAPRAETPRAAAAPFIKPRLSDFISVDKFFSLKPTSLSIISPIHKIRGLTLSHHKILEKGSKL